MAKVKGKQPFGYRGVTLLFEKLGAALAEED